MYIIMVSQVLHCRYASIVWDPHRQGIKTLHQVQCGTVRYVCNDYITRTHGRITLLLIQEGLLSVTSERYVH